MQSDERQRTAADQLFLPAKPLAKKSAFAATKDS
jgi:hypothetical protein